MVFLSSPVSTATWGVFWSVLGWFGVGWGGGAVETGELKKTICGPQVGSLRALICLTLYLLLQKEEKTKHPQARILF